jgi:choline dehydrogenase-like flavoprotein
MTTDTKCRLSPPTPDAARSDLDALKAEVAVIGTGPGGAVTAMLLAEAGYDVLLVEEGQNLPLDSAPHFSREEIVQKYRNGGVTIGMGRAKTAYVEGRCVGGGSQVNRGLYSRANPEVLAAWRREFAVVGMEDSEVQFHHEACEKVVTVSHLPGVAPPLSLKLREGGANLGWKVEELPRLVSYRHETKTGRLVSRKQSMTETFVPRFLRAGGRLVSDSRALNLTRTAGRWRVQTLCGGANGTRRAFELVAESVFLACGAIQTPALLRRSGITRNIGNTLRFHPMVKVVAAFPEEINPPGQLDPVHQVKQFDPRFSMGCSISSRPLLALSMVDHPDYLVEVDRNWRHMGIYYVQTTGGLGVIRTVPTFDDPLVRVEYSATELRDLGEGLRKLGECLFSAGAVALYPGIAGVPVIRSPGDLSLIPMEMPARRVNLSALHLFSTCPMGENEFRCGTDSFGRVRGTDNLYVSGAAILPSPTVVNPQGAVMAVAHRNALRFIENRRRPRSRQRA